MLSNFVFVILVEVIRISNKHIFANKLLILAILNEHFQTGNKGVVIDIDKYCLETNEVCHVKVKKPGQCFKICNSK